MSLGAKATARSMSASPSAKSFWPAAMSPRWNAWPAMNNRPSPRQTSASAWSGSRASVSAISFMARSKATVSPSMPANMSSRTLKSKRCWASAARLIVKTSSRRTTARMASSSPRPGDRRAAAGWRASPADAGDDAANAAGQDDPERLGAQARHDAGQDAERVAHGEDRDAEAQGEPTAGHVQPAVLGPQAHRTARTDGPAQRQRRAAAPRPSRRGQGRVAAIVRCRPAMCRGRPGAGWRAAPAT